MKPKKFLAVVTAATMITANSITPMPDKFVNLPVFNANAADIVASGECGAEGDNVIWQLDSEGMLTISGEGAMADNPNFGQHDITKVVVENGITCIGEYAFSWCENVTSITIENPECEIYDDEYTISNTAEIHGYAGSTAHAYAEKNNRNFKLLDEELISTITRTTLSVTSKPDYSLGDVNNDGMINPYDASLVLKEYALVQIGGELSLNEIEKKAADVDCNNCLDSRDANLILSYYSFRMSGAEPISLEEFVGQSGGIVLEYTGNANNGFTPDQIMASPVKPTITLTKSVISKDDCEDTQFVDIIVKNANEKWSSAGLHLYYDSRLTPAYNRIGQIDYNIGEAADYLSTVPIIHNESEHSLFFAATYYRNYGLDGVLSTFKFRIPENAQPGDVYYFDLKYVEGDVFSNIANDNESKLMQAYLFTEGIYNKEYNNNFTADPSDINKCSALAYIDNSYDGYIAIADEEHITTTTTSTTISTTTTTTTVKPTTTTTTATTEKPTTTITTTTTTTTTTTVKPATTTTTATTEKPTTTITATTTTTPSTAVGNVSWQMPDITVEKGTEIIEVPVLLLDYDNSQLAVSRAEFTLTYDYNALDLVELTSKSDAYCTDTIFTSAINQFSIETGSGNAIAGEHLANVVVFRFRIKDMSLNQDYFIRIKNFCAYDANGRNISDRIKTNDGRIRLVEKITTTTATSTTANSTTTTSTTTSTTTTTPPVTTEPYFILGDINADGSVDSSDASLVLAEYAKIQTGGAGEFTDIQYKAADVNKDDTVDSSDASRILAYYAAISTGQKPTWD